MRSAERGYQPVPHPEVKTFTEYLRAAGYYASNFFKLDYQFSGTLTGAPITNWDVETGGDWRGREEGQPFFAYKYIRNYQPETPYGQSIAFRNLLATMQEMFRLWDESLLESPADWYFHQTKPVKELYDTVADPFEIENLAARPELQAVLARMRAAHEAWVTETGDLGAVPEQELAERFWPGGVQPVTPPPRIDPAGGVFTKPVEVVIRSEIEGGSIAYRFDDEDSGGWKLYSGPLILTEGVVLRTRAVRYGWTPSEDVLAAFDVVGTQ